MVLRTPNQRSSVDRSPRRAGQVSADLRPSLMRPSGGLRWHLRALRYRECHGPFREQVASFLAAWEPDTTDLVLVGPSAGWFLPATFLTRFSRLLMMELDTSARFFPVASWTVAASGSSVHHVVDGGFRDQTARSVGSATQGGCAFCNVLGQLGLERSDYQVELAALKLRLSGRRWASFHDRFSSLGQDLRGRVAASFSSTRSMDAAMLGELGCSGEWTDHGTEHVFPDGTLRRVAVWSITKSRVHFVEMGSVG